MTLAPEDKVDPRKTRIRKKNINIILDSALEVFSHSGFSGSTLDQIAKHAGISKPNILYYFNSKEEIHLSLLKRLLANWLEPLKQLDPLGDPVTEITDYVQRKLEMSKEFPRESRLFAIEILQGAKHLDQFIRTDLKMLVKEKTEIIDGWVEKKQISRVDSLHLIFSIWATTQHYADFDTQIRLITGESERARQRDASKHLKDLFTKLLTP
jgi:TetR/AcrR family transcriptional regulator